MSAAAPELKENEISDIVSPKKSKNDKREYSIFKLNNGIECVVVSDPDTDKAAAALNVNVGHFADPDELPGLAHFLEHMLFLGTKKYPDEFEYSKYLKEHAGSSNASTAMSDTCYQFDIHPSNLKDALDRFAQFFISPLFTESATDREMNAVHSEHCNNLQSDSHRLYQFDKSLANDKHPFHKFGTGSLSTLKDDVPKNINVREELLKFHKKYYSSSIMTLAILGKDNIEDLTNLVAEKFSEIHNLKIKAPKYDSDVFDKKKFPCLFKMIPIKDKREIIISWPLPSSYYNYFERPCSLLSGMLGDEGPGSILQHLKDLGYATELFAGLDYNTPEFSMFRITIKLTPEGINKWTDIVEIVYQYIQIMHETSNDEFKRYWEERKKVNAMNFEFKGKEKPYNYVTTLAYNVQRYPKDNLLECGASLYFKWDINMIRKYLSFLNVDNSFYQLVSLDFKDEANEVEKWYGTQYKIEKLDEDILKTWKNAESNNKALSIPARNNYIADNFTLFCEQKDDEKQSEVPEVVDNQKGYKVWFRMDNEFKQPKLAVGLKYYSPSLNKTANEEILTDLFMSILNDILSQDTYTFNEAALSYSAYNGSTQCLYFSFYGYNQKLPLLVETVLEKFSNLNITEERYKIMYEKAKRSIQSMKKAKPYQQCDAIDTYVLAKNGFIIEELEQAIENCTYEKLIKHVKNILSNAYVESLIYGNASIKDSVPVYSQIIQKYLLNHDNKAVKIYEPKIFIKERNGPLKIPQNNTNYVVQFSNYNENDQNSAISNSYFYKADNSKDFASLRLFAHLIQARAFDELRTKEQLGYIVWSFNDLIRSYMSFRIVVQSANSKPDYLDERIELFLKNFRDEIDKMSDNQFEDNRKAVVHNLNEKPKHIADQNDRYWGEIIQNRYEWNRREEVAKYVEKITKDDVLAFYDNYISAKSKQRGKLSIQCYGAQSEIPKDKKNDDNIVYLVLKDIPKLREQLGYHEFAYKEPVYESKL